MVAEEVHQCRASHWLAGVMGVGDGSKGHVPLALPPSRPAMAKIKALGVCPCRILLVRHY